jgi:protein-disulfide isomerase
MKALRFLAATTLLCSLSYPVIAETPGTAPNANAPVTRGELHELVKQAIMDEPEIIMNAVHKIRDKQEAENKRVTAESFSKHRAELQNDKTSPSVGSKNADVTVIMFFDYHCGYCKKLLPTITKLLDEDKKVRVVFREFPILSEDSVSASRAALAVNRVAPDKYFAFHTALMKTQGAYSEEVLLSTAEKVGANRVAVKAEMDKGAVTTQLDQNRKLGEDLGVRGTPALFVGEKLLPGAVPYETLKRIIDETRSGKPSSEASPS